LSKIKLPKFKEEFFLESVWVFSGKNPCVALRRLLAGYRFRQALYNFGLFGGNLERPGYANERSFSFIITPAIKHVKKSVQ